MALIWQEVEQHAEVVSRLQEETHWHTVLDEVVSACIKSLTQGGKVLICGNGGSAADAQHIAAELSGRYLKDRPPLNAEALHVNTSYLTAVGNDYDFSEVFARAVLAKGSKGDVLIGLSTSGQSANVLKAVEQAKKLGLTTVAMVGLRERGLAEIAQYTLHAPSTSTPRIQEMHILFGHILCRCIEEAMFPDDI